MIKRLIFDLDNTLIEWKNEYNNIVEESLKAINYPYTLEMAEKVNQKEDEYGRTTLTYTRKGLVDYINESLNLNLPVEFVDEWVKRVPYCVPEKIDQNDYETLEYLSNKYELVVLTNYIGKPQSERLSKLGVLKFFKGVYGGDIFTKPHRQSFLNATGEYKIDECAMIGDNINVDIIGAKNSGIKKVVWKDNKNIASEYKDILNGVDVIKNLESLKDIF